MYTAAIRDYVPLEIVACISAMTDFYYLVRRDEIDEDTISAITDALGRFHFYREIFRTRGVRLRGFNLPRQHSMTHYIHCTREFGVSAGHCSSITESRHITAVKKPWRRSNRYNALGQMLLTNQRLEKIMAARADFIERGMILDDRPALHPEDSTREDDARGPAYADIDDAEAVDEEIASDVSLPAHAGSF